ncbi:MAG: intermembrane phospholipid transport protein YdbH family protein, partial [Desulfobulbales bacterium]
KKEILKIAYSSIDLKTSKPSFTLIGNGNTQHDELGLSLNSAELQLQYINTAIKTPQLNLKASYKQDKGQALKSGVAKFDLSLKNTALQQNGLSGSGDISLQGRVEIPSKAESTYQASGLFRVNKGEIYEAKNKLKMRGIEGKIPWQWPTAAQNSSGQIKIADIHFNDYDLGNFRANLRLRGMTYYLDGFYTSGLLPGIIADITGQAQMAPSGIRGEFAGHIEPTPVESLALGKFHPNLNKSYFSGRIGLESTLHFNSEGIIKGSLQARVQQGKFEMPEKKYLIEDIDLSVLLPVLPDLRSAPAQKIIFSKAALGDIVFEDGKIIWQLESHESLLVEESEFHWAGGRVFSSAVRLTPDMKTVTVPIFCDRLKLADLLEQFGVSNATGEGTVSGRIPVTIGKKTINFEDGFLYSSPGHGGSIKVAAFDTLAAGIPKNTPQFAQIDFAAEALKNFSYNWVKLLFNTKGEELVMQMQMDGKPVQALPFRYDSKTGTLQRIDAGTGGIDQPINLEVNFRLPLNRFLGYSGRIQDIINKMK